MTNSRIQGQHRHSFWNEIYETVLAPYIFLPTMLALINPKLGELSCDGEGRRGQSRRSSTARIAQPFLVLMRYEHCRAAVCDSAGVAVSAVRSGASGECREFSGADVRRRPRGNDRDERRCGRVQHDDPGRGDGGGVGEPAAAADGPRDDGGAGRHVVMPDGAMVQGVTADISSGGAMMLMETHGAAGGRARRLS